MDYRRGILNIPKSTWEYVQIMTKVGPHLEMWVGLESLGGVQHYTNRGCSLTVSRGHYPVVPAFFEEFSHTISKFDTHDFCNVLGELILLR